MAAMRDKYVTISLKNGAIDVNPDPVPVSWKKHDQVVWQGYGGQFDIVFPPGGSPFTHEKFSAASEGVASSGESTVQPPAGIQSFKYTVTLKVTNGPTLTLDPGVDVDGSGPPK